MVGYLDSSVALRHILLGEAAIEHALAADRVVSSELLEIECRRVIHRCRMQGDLDDTGVVTAADRLDVLLRGVSLIGLSREIKKRAMGAFPVGVKTLDALHLASALVLSEKLPDEKVVVFSHDAALNRCARALGFPAPLWEGDGNGEASDRRRLPDKA